MKALYPNQHFWDDVKSERICVIQPFRALLSIFILVLVFKKYLSIFVVADGKDQNQPAAVPSMNGSILVSWRLGSVVVSGRSLIRFEKRILKQNKSLGVL